MATINTDCVLILMRIITFNIWDLNVTSYEWNILRIGTRALREYNQRKVAPSVRLSVSSTKLHDDLSVFSLSCRSKTEKLANT